MAKFCSNCGKPLAEGLKFCSNCGTPVATDETAAQPATAPAPETPSEEKKKSKKPIIPIAAVFMALIIVVTGLAWPGWMRSKSSKTKTKTTAKKLQFWMKIHL